MMLWAGLLVGLSVNLALRLQFDWPTETRAPPAASNFEPLWKEEVFDSGPDTFRNFSGAGPGTPRISTLRVIDGDTFETGGMRIRIADIDTPETAARCAYEAALATRATERLRILLAAGPFELHPIAGRDEDQFGRKLRIVTRGGRSLGDRLVSEGLARTWTGRREPWC